MRVNIMEEKVNIMEDFTDEAARQLYKMLSKPAEEKLPFEGIDVARTLSKLPFFPRWFDIKHDNFITLCIKQTSCQFADQTDIYGQEHQSKCLYVVLMGSVRLSRKETTRKVGTYGIFGETEILFALGAREQKAVAEGLCRCMRISGANLMKQFNQQTQIQKCFRYIDASKYFMRLDSFEKQQLALKMRKISFSPQQKLQTEGEEINRILFLIYGRISVCRSLLVRGDTKNYLIDYLEEMSSYGEYENVMNQLASVSLEGVNTGAFYSLQFKEVIDSGHTILEQLRNNAISYPAAEELRFLKEVKDSVRMEQQRARKFITGKR